jgi:hypothetical protein
VRIRLVSKVVQKEAGCVIFYTRNGQITIEFARFLVTRLKRRPHGKTRLVKKRLDLGAESLKKRADGCSHKSVSDGIGGE